MRAVVNPNNWDLFTQTYAYGKQQMFLECLVTVKCLWINSSQIHLGLGTLNCHVQGEESSAATTLLWNFAAAFQSQLDVQMCS